VEVPLRPHAQGRFLPVSCKFYRATCRLKVVIEVCDLVEESSTDSDDSDESTASRSSWEHGLKGM
jgi:hypothetical protein